MAGPELLDAACWLHCIILVQCFPKCQLAQADTASVHNLTSYLLLTQGDGDVGVAAEHEEGAAGAEMADADMADAGDGEDDGVTPQKRKTSPEHVVSSTVPCPGTRLPKMTETATYIAEMHKSLQVQS